MHSLTLQSPAKINLYLRVTGRRSNGYHELVTLFHRISLQDTLCLTSRESGFTLKCSNPNLPVDQRNLITKAYHLLKQELPDIKGVSVDLKKNIPVAAGLGGGSGNAAAFLLGMKKLYRLRLSRAKLIRMGKRLGADVAFFLYDVNQALATGVGDRIYPRISRTTHHFLLLISDQGVSTKRVYQNLPQKLPAVSLTKEKRAVRILRNLLERKDFVQASGLLRNDLEPVAIRLNPSIQQTIEKLKQFGLRNAQMSGSGPTVFAILSNLRQARSVLRWWKRIDSNSRAVICHTY